MNNVGFDPRYLILLRVVIMAQQGISTKKKSITREALSVAPLPTRRLGKTDLEVPILGYGSAPGGIGLSDNEAIKLLHRAIDLGVKYLDTAPGYSRRIIRLAKCWQSGETK